MLVNDQIHLWEWCRWAGLDATRQVWRRSVHINHHAQLVRVAVLHLDGCCPWAQEA